MPYLSAASKQALSAAVVAVEQASSVELVVALRPACTPALLPAALGGAVLGLSGLGYLLFSPTPFSHEAILLDTALCWLTGALCSVRSSHLRRWLTPRSVALRCVQQLAATEFIRRGVGETRGRTGILVCVAQVEQVASVVLDRGVRRAIRADLLDPLIAKIERVARERADGLALAAAIEQLCPVLREHLPRSQDDVNELEDDLCAD